MEIQSYKKLKVEDERQESIKNKQMLYINIEEASI